MVTPVDLTVHLVTRGHIDLLRVSSACCRCRMH
ncbi:putative leader peptide [Jatrophihabitans sp. DSM 45814]